MKVTLNKIHRMLVEEKVMNASEINILTERLELRCITPLDAESIFEYRSSEEVGKFQTWRPKLLKEVEEFISEKVSRIPNIPDTWYQLGIIIKENNEFIGDVGIHFCDEDNLQVEIGYTLSEKYQGKGYATEAVTGVIDYLFNVLNKHRITASVDPQNKKSITLLERIGMRKEAHFKKSFLFNNEWVDDVIYAILKEEWNIQ